MIKYISYLCLYLPIYLLAMLVAPILPLFSVTRFGWSNNRSVILLEPRLPNWLFWFDTSIDNSLYGDDGHKERWPSIWDTYLGQVLWLWRNPAAGFSWSVLSAVVIEQTTYQLTETGAGIKTDKGQGTLGSFLITSSNGYFQYRIVKKLFGNKIWTFDAGWLLDVYIKNPTQVKTQSQAPFQFQPQIRTQKL